jgi:alpha-mannosidase
MSTNQGEISRRDFLIAGAATLGAVAAAPVLAQQASAADPGRRKVLHIIGHSHIDAAWLWPWRAGSDTVLTTFRSAESHPRDTWLLLYAFVVGALQMGRGR